MNEGHSHSGEHRWMDKSGHGRKLSESGTLTNWRVQMDKQVRTQKESEQARGTHFLESTDGWTSQDTKGILVSKGHSLPRDCRDKLGHRRNPSKQEALTN